MHLERTTVETTGFQFAAVTAGDGDRYALCFHGFPDDPRTFEPLATRLVEAGYTVAAPWMRGYGETESPPLDAGNFTPFDLASDVFAIADALGAEAPLLVGHDWGAIAVTAASVADPDRFDACATMAVPPNFAACLHEHPTQTLRSWYMTEFQVPGHAEDLLRRDDFALIERLWRLWSPGWRGRDEHLSRVKETFRTGETVEAALLYYRDFFDEFLSRRPSALTVRGIDVPTLVLAGERDGCIGVDLFDGVTDCYGAQAELEVVSGAGHFLHLEKPDVVADRVLQFVDG